MLLPSFRFMNGPCTNNNLIHLIYLNEMNRWEKQNNRNNEIACIYMVTKCCSHLNMKIIQQWKCIKHTRVKFNFDSFAIYTLDFHSLFNSQRSDQSEKKQSRKKPNLNLSWCTRKQVKICEYVILLSVFGWTHRTQINVYILDTGYANIQKYVMRNKFKYIAIVRQKQRTKNARNEAKHTV